MLGIFQRQKLLSWSISSAEYLGLFQFDSTLMQYKISTVTYDIRLVDWYFITLRLCGCRNQITLAHAMNNTGSRRKIYEWFLGKMKLNQNQRNILGLIIKRMDSGIWYVTSKKN